MKMFLVYVMGLLYFRTRGNCSGLADELKISHDSLTRFIKKEQPSQKRLGDLLQKQNLSGGCIIFDDTPSEKSHSHTLEGLSRVYSTKLSKTIYGYCTVTMIWTDGKIRIPLSLRLWKPNGKTKVELALEMLSYARNQLKLKPDYVLFDSWYAAKSILKRIRDYGWHFITRLKTNRKLNGVPLKKCGWRHNWKGEGFINGGIKVRVVKKGNKFYATNRLSLPRKQLLSIYSDRFIIEEVHRIVKQECCFCSCQARSFLAQENHRWCSFFAFAVLEIERARLGTTVYKLRKNLCRKSSTQRIPLFEELLASA